MAKKPRLFYYEDAVDAWCPVPVDVDGIVSLEMMDEGDVQSVQFKRIDMTDEEFDNMPEG